MRPSLRIEEVLEAVRKDTVIVTPHAEGAIADEKLTKEEVLHCLPKYDASFGFWDWYYKTPRLLVLARIGELVYKAVFARGAARQQDILMVTFTVHDPEHYRLRGIGYPDIDGSVVFDFSEAA